MSDKKNKDPFDVFNVVDPAERGKKLYLHLPSGEKTEHWLLVRGQDAEVFRKATIVSNRVLAQYASQSDDEVSEIDYAEKTRDQTRWLIAHLVKDWSKDAECNPEVVEEFLRTAPQIEKELNTFAANLKNFHNANFDESPTS